MLKNIAIGIVISTLFVTPIGDNYNNIEYHKISNNTFVTNNLVAEKPMEKSTECHTDNTNNFVCVISDIDDSTSKVDEINIDTEINTPEIYVKNSRINYEYHSETDSVIECGIEATEEVVTEKTETIIEDSEIVASDFVEKFDDITQENDVEYIKSVPDEYGFNEGEAYMEYLPHEEYFYNDYYDHWNVDLVYDEEIIKEVFGGN